MDHALAFAITAGIVGLIFLSALLLRQGSRVVASLDAMRAERMGRSSIAATAGGSPSPAFRAPSNPYRPREEDTPDDDMFVPVHGFDADGNASTKWMRLEVLLRGVGIGRADCDPTLAVVEQAQTELRALGELAAHIGPDNSEGLDLSDLGNTLADISRRLDIAHEFLDRPQGAQSASRESRKGEEPPEEPEPPSSDDGDEEQG